MVNTYKHQFPFGLSDAKNDNSKHGSGQQKQLQQKKTANVNHDWYDNDNVGDPEGHDNDNDGDPEGHDNDNDHRWTMQVSSASSLKVHTWLVAFCTPASKEKKRNNWNWLSPEGLSLQCAFEANICFTLSQSISICSSSKKIRSNNGCNSPWRFKWHGAFEMRDAYLNVLLAREKMQMDCSNQASLP